MMLVGFGIRENFNPYTGRASSGSTERVDPHHDPLKLIDMSRARQTITYLDLLTEEMSLGSCHKQARWLNKRHVSTIQLVQGVKIHCQIDHRILFKFSVSYILRHNSGKAPSS